MYRHCYKYHDHEWTVHPWVFHGICYVKITMVFQINTQRNNPKLSSKSPKFNCDQICLPHSYDTIWTYPSLSYRNHEANLYYRIGWDLYIFFYDVHRQKTYTVYTYNLYSYLPIICLCISLGHRIDLG